MSVVKAWLGDLQNCVELPIAIVGVSRYLAGDDEKGMKSLREVQLVNSGNHIQETEAPVNIGSACLHRRVDLAAVSYCEHRRYGV
jgi:hypothetical protein